MLGLARRLRELETASKPIRTAIVGAGQMGRGAVSQMMSMQGMRPSLVIDRTLEKVLTAFRNAGVADERVKTAHTPQQAGEYIAQGFLVAATDISLAGQTPGLDVVIDATGNTEAGTVIALEAIANKRHIIMLNVETDVTVGVTLRRLAQEAGVVYTGSAGDEPGAVMELYEFAQLLGFEILVMGKGKNNKVDLRCTPDTVRCEAEQRGISPRMLCAFKDGTKTMVELTAMANATGFLPDVRGAHGPQCTLDQLIPTLSLQSEGGVLRRFGAVEYIDGIAPGVFVVITTDKPDLLHELTYLKMGDGPRYVLYRPYHLCSIETPISVARAVLDGEATIVPEFGQVAETVTVAKRDVAAGELLDGIGGEMVYGTIETGEEARRLGALPIGLLTPGARMKTAVKAGELLTYDMVQLEEDALIVRLRRQQDQQIN